VVVLVVVVMVVEVIITFIWGIYKYIPEANYFSRVRNKALIPFSQIIIINATRYLI
jgi:hypothetical protein